MNSEYILDAIGLLDDDLIQEAETCSSQKRKPDYGTWLGWAASFAVVIVLGYWLAGGMGMGGGSAAPDNESGGAAGGQTSASSQLPPEENSSNGGADSLPYPADPGAPDSENSTGDWLPAIRVNGVVYYWDTQAYIHLEPEEDDIQYTTSFINSWEPEEDGQANFLPIGLPYVVLDNGTVAVLHNEETNTWKVYDSVPPWER